MWREKQGQQQMTTIVQGPNTQTADAKMFLNVRHAEGAHELAFMSAEADHQVELPGKGKRLKRSLRGE